MDKNGKILMATLTGIGAGIVAGIMLAPDNGKTTREGVMRSLSKSSDELNKTMKTWLSKIRGTQTNEDEELVMHGSWDDVKSQLRENYDEITEDDAGTTTGNK
ncbi:YtxH domain-containing protein [Pontibacter sp. Tf4]|uniref:YtxH domain-containing protein n=1 Tax=Pontibacter sp. Tf4 TaxID=2761620 RepID=UPI00162520BA|nr:YtxH domain-containing protein [Pontibacter sp. Tf4]MBB6610872.1 YtxH domain-containing protein [Pontibacter sp. Tf4]